MSYYRGKPVENFDELLKLYATEDRSQIPIYRTLENAKSLIEELYEQETSDGFVISVEASWGSGKTSFIRLLQKELEQSLNISVVSFDSLYYGNASEATTILIDSIFQTLKNDFGIRIKEGFEIAQNITPEFEFTNGLPKLTLRYIKERKSTESILNDGVRAKLRSMEGRLLVIIDDIDRLPPEDAIHFLRIIRVLKELPNVIVMLPIDRANLEDLIRTQNVTKPKAYLQKIIDQSYNIDPNAGDARILFQRLLDEKYKAQNIASTNMTELLWNLVLWEISLIVIKHYERQGSARFKMSAAASDPANWNLLEPISLPNGDNLVRKFIEQTSFDYGGTNYLVHVNDHATTGQNQRAIYRHYRLVCGEASFTDFIYGTYLKTLNPQVEDVNFGGTMMDFRWWMEKDIQPLAQSQTQASEYFVSMPQDAQERSDMFSNINNLSRSIWDDVAGMASQFLPPQVTPYLSARTLNRIVNALDLNMIKKSEDAETQRIVRRVVQNEIDFTAE
jgi:hypothetical protein